MDINKRVSGLVENTKKNLFSRYGRTLKDCNTREFFQCFSMSIRDLIIPLWKATLRSYEHKEAKAINYFSMEYLLGRALTNNLINLGIYDDAKLAVETMGKGLNVVEEIESDAGLGSGGLGRLAACFLDSLSTLKYPAVGYGLRYKFGMFSQEILDGLQIEKADRWLSTSNPWEIRRNDEAVIVEFGGKLLISPEPGGRLKFNVEGHESVLAVPFDIPIVGWSNDGLNNVNTLRLWSAEEEPRNFGIIEYNQGEFEKAFRNNTITYVLYPDDSHEEGKRLRLKQQFFLVSASLQDILRKFKMKYDNFEKLPEKVHIQINDTHPTLVIPELMRILTQVEGLAWNKSWGLTTKVCGFTNHTIMKEALEIWSIDIFKTVLPRQYEIIERLNNMFSAEIRVNFPSDEERVKKMAILTETHVRMANLAIVGSHSVNGVAELHTSILKKKTFKDFYELYPDKFLNVTNGITPRRWLLKANPVLAALITSRIGEGWITNLSELKKLIPYSNDKSFIEKIKEIKLINKDRLVNYINQYNPYRDSKGNVQFQYNLNNHALFDVQIKRLHEYKRQLMNVLSIIMTCQELKENPNLDIPPRVYIFAAKAAAAYKMAKNIIKLINSVAKKIHLDPILNKKLEIVFIENYNVSKAEIIIPAADLSEQISTASMEASGTGNMKFSLNGALTIGTDDGANIEMKEEVGEEGWPFTFGLNSNEVLDYQAKGGYDAEEYLAKNPKIKKVLDTLIDGTYGDTEENKLFFSEIYQSLVSGRAGAKADKFFVLRDLPQYHETQKKVSELYNKESEWYRLTILNIANMGKFSTDNSIENYSKKIWNITKVPVDIELLELCNKEFE